MGLRLQIQDSGASVQNLCKKIELQFLLFSILRSYLLPKEVCKEMSKMLYALLKNGYLFFKYFFLWCNRVRDKEKIQKDSNS